MLKYRAKPFYPFDDIWVIEKRFLFFWWMADSYGTESQVKSRVAQLNNKNL